MVDLADLSQVIQEGDSDKVVELVQKALEDKIEPMEIVNKGLLPPMDVIGEKFEREEIFLPELVISAQAMKVGMDILRPILTKAGQKPRAKIVIGTVEGDMHDIGKNLVGMILQGAGFEVIDLGTDVQSKKFIHALKENDVPLLGLSALLTTTMIEMKTVIDDLVKEGMREKVKVIIGGAPTSQEFASEIGADGYAPDAISAKDKINELLES
jgi:5-methyltetrahydrofolate--homocysteine methyltransferase